ncbi:aminodeoxychorismate lyase [Bowmanella yangjiangensis]|uniref:Aminodeoxychorismate lyase n=1 Tax=Bowmanella yangjiangensis TaxID=2811230 RepID=A0ABS3CU33_9ALTE|nr:aminodeoxychorismate lyase [Bowmanella yangjiangensis]MBN7820623.1 aminodeoxychorismate lyase [Bowmanella yangjiangensis]
MTSSLLVNGQPADQLAVTDRATQYGDGVFSTLRIKDGELQFWQAHLDRLKTGLERLGIDFSCWDRLQDCCVEQAIGHSEGVLKILISRGSGGRGYLPPSPAQATWILSLHPMPVHYALWRQQGITLQLSPLQLAKQPLLAGIKHLNRLEQVLIRQHAEAQGWQDALVCDTDGMLVESSVANLFWQVGNSWYTPDLHFAGVDGIMRQQLVKALELRGDQVYQVRSAPSCLLQAEQLLLCNSLMGVVPVNSYAGHFYHKDDVAQLNKECGFV